MRVQLYSFKNWLALGLLHWQQRLPAVVNVAVPLIIALGLCVLGPDWSSVPLVSGNVVAPAGTGGALGANSHMPPVGVADWPGEDGAIPWAGSKGEPGFQEASLWGVAPAMSLALSANFRLPDNIDGLEGEDRKKLFIGVVLPTIMVVLDEVGQERQQLLAIINELGDGSADVTFAEDKLDWQQVIGEEKSRFIIGLTRKYRTLSAKELLAMVNVLPPSLVIAQGALESSWGASRSATEGNNLFGMYMTVEHGGKNDTGGSGKGTRIMAYASILDSVRAYVLNINRLPAYRELRRIRCQTLDPMRIAEGLAEYSERKEYYIADVKNIIVGNKLQDLDALIQVAG